MDAQDQGLFTRNYQAKIVKKGADLNCRFCEKFEDTADQLVSGCPIMTPNDTYKDTTRWDYIFTGKYISTIMHHMLRHGTNRSHRNM